MGVGVIPIVGSYSDSHDVMDYHHRHENHQSVNYPLAKDLWISLNQAL